MEINSSKNANIRNFVIIAHIDSGKSTLADRFLEVTHTVEARDMMPQYLDRLPLERERGITIKMAPVRMLWHSNRGLSQTETQTVADSTQTNADNNKEFLYEDITYKIRGAAFKVKKELGLGHKEVVYQKALREEFQKMGLAFEAEKSLDVFYGDTKVGLYRPDFIVENKIIVELKALPFISKQEESQQWNYLKGSVYKIALLINFGGHDIYFKRIVYDTARPESQRQSAFSPRESAQVEYIFNLIDTPGHSDFSYEVSRALVAVEGAVLLIDATKGIQAQTLSNLRAARKAGLTIIGAVNKVDLQLPHLPKIVTAVAHLLDKKEEEIFLISAKTGTGVKEILEEVARVVPPPRTIADNTLTNAENNSLRESASSQRESAMPARALVFDSLYDDHKGIIAFVRVFDGKFKTGDEVRLLASGAKFKIKELGYFSPDFKPSTFVSSGEIGYIATGIKEPALVKIGDTVFCADIPEVGSRSAKFALPGYREAAPVVFISLYPDGATKFDDLLKAIGRLQLNDAALNFEPDANEALGRGLKVGFLGQLHFEITASRLAREFNLEFITSFPSIAYRVLLRNTADQRRLTTQTNAEKNSQRQSVSSPRESAIIVKQPQDFPDDPEKVWHPMIKLEILTPQQYVGQVVNLKNVFDLEIGDVINMGENLIISGRMPLAELIRDFDDQLKSASAGFASFSYELDGEAEAEAEKLEILIAEEVMPELTRIVPRKDLEREARSTVERLKELIPKQQFTQAIQAKSHGRIIARETVPAMKKLLGNFGKTGGDRTRKMKLWKKQQRGKEKLKEMGRVKLSPEIFRDILKK